MSSDLSLLATHPAPMGALPAARSLTAPSRTETPQAVVVRAVNEGRVGPPPTFDVNVLQQLLFQRTQPTGQSTPTRDAWPRDDRVDEAKGLNLRV